MLSFQLGLNILIFLPVLGWKYSFIILKLKLLTSPFLNVLRYKLQLMRVFLFCFGGYL